MNENSTMEDKEIAKIWGIDPKLIYTELFILFGQKSPEKMAAKFNFHNR